MRGNQAILDVGGKERKPSRKHAAFGRNDGQACAQIDRVSVLCMFSRSNSNNPRQSWVHNQVTRRSTDTIDRQMYKETSCLCLVSRINDMAACFAMCLLEDGQERMKFCSKQNLCIEKSTVREANVVQLESLNRLNYQSCHILT